MANFCRYCGSSIEDGKTCDCQKDKVNAAVNEFKEQRKEEKAKKESLLERDDMIIPDNVASSEGEIPIKQYKLAKLRSRIRGQYSEGKLMLTNKRLIFRAPGFSPRGKVFVQHEFAIDDIAGVDVQVGNKISVLNIFFSSYILSAFLMALSSSLSILGDEHPFWAGLLSIILLLINLMLAVVIRKNDWFRLAFLSAAYASFMSLSDFRIGFSGIDANGIILFLSLPLLFWWIKTLFKVCFTPDLIFTVKTNGAGEAITIRRKIWGIFLKQPQEYTGFSEVLPWDDAEKVAKELNTIIDELNTTGDDAVKKWKEI